MTKAGREQKPRATLCFLIDGNKVLLGMKKRRFAEGKWNGFGGKQGEGEEVLETAIREFEEEAEMTPRDLKQVALLDCHHPEWSQQVMVYITSHWDGEPVETEEMRPKWFAKSDLPFGQMWEDEAIWLPLILEGKKIEAVFHFGKKGELLDKKIEVVERFK